MIRSSDIAKSPAMSRSVRSESWWRASTHGTTASATSAAEHEGAHARDVGAETVGHLAVLRDRADHQAGARPAEEQPYGDADRAAQHDQEEPIARIENAAQVDRALEQRWGLHALGGRAIEHAYAFLEDQREPERQQELVDRPTTRAEAHGRRIVKSAEH